MRQEMGNKKSAPFLCKNTPPCGPIKIPGTQIFLPASQHRAQHKRLQFQDYELRLELQLNAHYVHGSPVACTGLDSWLDLFIFGGVVVGRNLVYGIFFFDNHENSSIVNTNIESARQEAPAGRLKWARHITHLSLLSFLIITTWDYPPLCLELCSFPIRTSQDS